MANAYPLVEPHERGLLDVGDGQRIYWEVRGRPDGLPAVMLHGGPGGGGQSPGVRFFDPDAYRVITVDQRGCGRSTPHAGDFTVGLSTNTTHHLIRDLEVLRTHLGVQRWVVWGGSWGVTLALAYAQRFPQRVSAMVLASVTMTRAQDVHWLAHDVGRFFPEQWARFAGGVPKAERDDLVAAYDRRINHHPDPQVRLRAVSDWTTWEDALLSLEDVTYTGTRTTSTMAEICFARIVTHYFTHAAWLEPGELLRDADRLAGVPGVLVHGRLDLAGPPDVPWLLARRWPGARLHLTAGGHLGDDDSRGIQRAAADRFRSLS